MLGGRRSLIYLRQDIQRVHAASHRIHCEYTTGISEGQQGLLGPGGDEGQESAEIRV
jgi:hypothetical protein